MMKAKAIVELVAAKLGLPAGMIPDGGFMVDTGEADECSEIFAQEYNGTVLIETSHAAS